MSTRMYANSHAYAQTSTSDVTHFLARHR